MADPLKDIRDVASTHLVEFDFEIVEAILATTLTNFLDSPPVWLLLIAPPSSGKTLMLAPLSGIFSPLKPYLISDITENTLLSGAVSKRNEDPSLLTMLGDNPIVIIKEMGTALEKAENKSIFAQLREVYDGEMRKITGMGTNRYWKGHATFIVGMTPHFDTYSAANTALGDRFIKLRFAQRSDPYTASLQTISKMQDENERQRLIADAYREALFSARDLLYDVSFGAETQSRIAAAASLMTRIRTGVMRDKYRSNQIVGVSEQEGVQRATQALVKFCGALAALRGETDLTDYGLLKRVALSAATESRKRTFLDVKKLTDQGIAPKASQLNTRLGDSQKHQELEDLFHIKMLDRKKADSSGRGRKPYLYTINEDTQKWLQRLEG